MITTINKTLTLFQRLLITKENHKLIKVIKLHIHYYKLHHSDTNLQRHAVAI